MPLEPSVSIDMNRIVQLFRLLGGRWNRWLDSLSPYDPEAIRAGGGKPVEIDDAPVRKRFALIVIIAFATFLLWAFFAPLDAGVSVPGNVVVFGNRKAVQHPSGGVVESIAVREGSVVKKGDLLLKINPLNVEANLNAVELDYINALAAESRLLAERSNSSIRWMDELAVMADDPRAREARQLQQYMFDSQKKDMEGQRQILQEQLDGYGKQLAESHNIQKIRQRQLELMNEEMKNNKELADEGFIPRSKANEIERNRSEVLASLASTASDISKTLSTMAGTRLQLAQLSITRRKDVDSQLADVQKNRKGMKSKVDSLRFDLSLAELRAPVSGVVVNSKVYTVGGVIQGSQMLMEIVPMESTLIVEAQIPPNMIDKVHVGLEADIRFSAFNMNTTPVIPGKVKLIGADKIKNPEKGNDEYYLAQIETTAHGRALLEGKTLQPGMPVEVIIKTGERSFMSYLTKPITDRFAKSFKED